MPGFAAGYPFALLPFWGNNCLVDFAVGNFTSSRDTSVTIVLDEANRGLALALASRYRRPLIPVPVLEAGLAELAARVAAEESEFIVLASLSSVCVFDPRALLDLLPSGGDIVKLAIQKTPVEMYVARRDALARLFAAHAVRARRGGRVRDYLFNDILFSAIDLIEDLPGELLFQNDLMEFYRRNIWAIANCEGESFNRILSRLPPLAEPSKESRVSEKGSLKDSILASGVEVEGSVEGSILFPGVLVRRGAFVSNSVVLNGNRIGAGSAVHNALLLPYVTDAPRTGPNIGDNCLVGAKSSAAKNSDFPSQIRDGIALVGMNVDLPNGFKAEAATYIGPGVSPAALRKLKVLRRGASLYGGQE